MRLKHYLVSPPMGRRARVRASKPSATSVTSGRFRQRIVIAVLAASCC